uniref:FGGY family carbohydrate kinase n=1 Tax=Clostridium sp. NkU-1 TaxID=1095009 RepID=UPI000AFE15EF
MMDKQIGVCIREGKTALGIELGSTRIKAVLIDEDHNPIASGSHDWENQYVNGVWTYSIPDIWEGVRESYRKMAEEVKVRYGETLTTMGAICFSAMMHGYMAFDRKGELLVPFRTWRNTMAEEASKKADGAVFLSNSPAMEYCTSISGNP